ncbi:MAG: ABC transporter ATP-binding protein [Bacteroidales bacterium]|nr:ABC transporter ATP-binding protein [Bacteroidales bacterium]MBP3254816.1 ABC transporter ATP-binding protein [Bacteroidales bacterium]
MIEIKNLKFHYKRNKTILQDINLQLQEGKITGLLGKNGVGKSTLLHLTAGLQFPIEGSITLDGQMPQKRTADVLKNLFLLSEEVPETTMTIAKFVKINSVFYPKFSHEDFKTYMSEFEVTDFAQRIDKLSFGTRKKVFIAFALACNTKYLLMDEPTNGLDIPSKASFRKILRLAMMADKLAVISTHQARDLQNILDSIVILDDTHLLLNADDWQITEKLCFGIATGLENEDDILYSEPTVAGNQIVKVNKDAVQSNLDVELLFNAAFNRKDKFKELFNIK